MKALALVTVHLFLSLQSLHAQGDVQEAPAPVPLAAVECEDSEMFAGEVAEPELWAARLCEKDLDLRMAAYEAITEAGAKDPVVFRALQGWAMDPSCGELGWTARMALREIAEAPEQQPDPWGFGTPDLDWLQDSYSGRGGLSPIDFERNLVEKFEQLHRQMTLGLAPGAAPGASVERRIIRFDLGPEGWQVHTHRLGSEGEEERYWEAENIDALLRAHPELEEEFPGLGGLRLRFGASADGGGPVVPPVDMGPRTDVLGVECRPLTAAEAQAMERPVNDAGILVVRTVPGSIADELGVRRGDTLLRLNGAPLGIPSHITQALARREPQASVNLWIIDTQGQARTLVWSPETPEGPDPGR